MKNIFILLVICSLSVVGLSFAGSRPKDYTLTATTKRVFMSGTKKYLTARVILTNNTPDTLKYLSMSCNLQRFYTLKSDMLNWPALSCKKNFPIGLALLPQQRDTVEINLIFKDNNAKIVNYQIAMELAKDEGSNSLNLLYHKKLKSTSIFTNAVVWKQ